MNLRVALVLCSFNGARWLPEQLASLAAQTRQPDQYIFCDDASSDASWDILKAFAGERRAEGRQVILRRNAENLGFVRNFAEGFALADADLIFPCDQDDVWAADKISVMSEAFERDPTLLLLHADARLVDQQGHPQGDLFPALDVEAAELRSMHAGRAFTVLLRRNIVTGAAMAFRASLLGLVPGFAEHWAHDEWLAIFAAMHGRVETLERVVIDYRQHGGNQIGAQARQGLQKAGLGVARAAYQRRQVLRLEELLMHAPASHREAVAHRLAHARIRAQAAAKLSARPAVVREWLRGGYQRYGRGARSALADLLGLD